MEHYNTNQTMESLKGLKKKQSLGSIIQSSVLTGRLVVIPIFLSLWCGWSLYSLLTGWTEPAIQAIPPEKIPDWLSLFWISHIVRIVSLILVCVILFLIGLLTKIALGRRLISVMEYLLLKLPIINFIYTTCKQIGDALWSSKKGNMFRQVVLFEYPRKGVYAIGFLTSENKEPFEVTEKLNRPLVSVFMPTTPNPTSGFLMYVPREDCQFLDMSVSDAMRLIVSCGAVLPDKPKPAGDDHE